MNVILFQHITNKWIVITRKLRALKGPQIRTYTRYGTGSVVMFDYAKRNSLVKQSEQSPSKNRFHWRFRIDRLTKLVPTLVRFVLRNDDGVGIKI